jgi:hypothetical protein
MTRDAAFYFSNLGADVTRCVSALKQGDEDRYQDSLARAYHTADYIRALRRPEAYEEALLMLRGLDLARETPATLASFQSAIDSLIGTFSARITT